MLIKEIAVDSIMIGPYAERKMLKENLTYELLKENVRKVISGINYFEDEDFEVCDEKYLYIINMKGDAVTLIGLFTEDQVY